MDDWPAPPLDPLVLATAMSALGERALLRGRTLALLCSVRCPGGLAQRTYELAHRLRDAGVTVIGGFHTPLERECLKVLLRGRQPVIVCPARSVEGMRLTPEWKAPLEAGRLLLISPFATTERRATADLAAQRNAFVASLAAALFVAYAQPGGKTESLVRTALAAGTPVFTFDAPENGSLLALGAQSLVTDHDWRAWAFDSPPLPPAPLLEGLQG